jgi:hypothetical protein
MLPITSSQAIQPITPLMAGQATILSLVELVKIP